VVAEGLDFMTDKVSQFPKFEMSTANRGLMGIALALAFGLCTCSLASAQLTAAQASGRSPQGPEMTMPGPATPNTGPFQGRRIRQLNVERQKEMVSDTEKLLKLTAELNAEVAQNHSATFTPDQLRTLAKIEKLAKSVKEKMSNPVQGTIFQDSFPPAMSPPALP
jgi:hypothetical protein